MVMRRMLLRASLSTSIIVALPALALAQKSVAPLVPKIDPARDAEIVVRFHDALGAGLKAGGLSIVEPATVRSRAGAQGCDEGSCLTAAQSKVGTRVATAKITIVGKNYAIEVKVYSGSTLQGSASGRCDICTFAEALTSTTNTAKEAGTKAATATSSVPDVTPRVLKPSVEDPPRRRRVATTKEPIPMTPPPGPTVSTRARFPLWPALLTLGVGVGGLGAGIPLLVLNGKYTNCVGTPRADGRNCADLFRTSAGGWTATAVGIAGLVGSGVLFYLHFASRGEPEGKETPRVKAVSLQPADGGLVLGASGTF